MRRRELLKCACALPFVAMVKIPDQSLGLPIYFTVDAEDGDIGTLYDASGHDITRDVARANLSTGEVESFVRGSDGGIVIRDDEIVKRRHTHQAPLTFVPHPSG